VHLTALLWKSGNIAIPFGMEKLEWHGCPMVKKFEDYLAALTEYRRVTYRQTDRHLVIT